jgi:hypothetical protein
MHELSPEAKMIIASNLTVAGGHRTILDTIY